jgi:hypothetical protein
VFFIALAVQGDECGVVAVGKGEHRAGGGEQRRRLIEAAIEAAEDPVEPGDLNRRADAGRRAVLDELALESRLAQTGDQREPAGGLVVVRDVLFDDAAAGGVGFGDGWGSAAVVEGGAEEVAVPLVEEVDATLQRVVRERAVGGLDGERDLSAEVVGGAVGSGGDGSVGGRGVVVGLVVVEEGRGLEDG